MIKQAVILDQFHDPEPPAEKQWSHDRDGKNNPVNRIDAHSAAHEIAAQPAGTAYVAGVRMQDDEAAKSEEEIDPQPSAGKPEMREIRAGKVGRADDPVGMQQKHCYRREGPPGLEAIQRLPRYRPRLIDGSL